MVHSAEAVLRRQGQHLDKLFFAEAIHHATRIFLVPLPGGAKLIHVEVLRRNRIAGVDGHVRDAGDLGPRILGTFLSMQSGAAEQREDQQSNGTPRQLHMVEPALGALRIGLSATTPSSRKIAISADPTSPALPPASVRAHAASAD